MQTAQSSEDEDTRALLLRVLEAVETPSQSTWKQVTRAVILALATLVSTWSGYQASRWNVAAGRHASEAGTLARQAAELRIQAIQVQAFDATMVIHYLEALESGNQRLADFLRSRFTPTMKPAIEAWLKTSPLTNPDAPLTPFKMAEYSPPEVAEARRIEENRQRAGELAAESGRAANEYVLLTVVFASVLFFGALSNSMRSRGLQDLILAVAVFLFATTVFRIIFLPVAPWG